MVVFNYLPKSYEVSNTTIIANSSDKSMDLVKYFYLLHFCHSLLPFYIAPCTGRKKAAAQCFVQQPFLRPVFHQLPPDGAIPVLRAAAVLLYNKK